MINVTISGNAGWQGGGIYFDWNTDLEVSPTMTNVIISGNTASDEGGGIYCNQSSTHLTIANVTISGNAASDNGGGIYLSTSSLTMTNVTIIGNTASDNGGGIFCDTSSPTITNVTISGNAASDNGGGIYYFYGSIPIISNSIISHNIGNYGIWDIEPGSSSITYSDFYNNQNGNFYNIENYVGLNLTTNANGDSVDAYNNIQLDPNFVDVANGDYRLSDFSPAIGARHSYRCSDYRLRWQRQAQSSRLCTRYGCL